MTKVPDNIKENIYRMVKRDLNPSRYVVHSKIGASVSVGGVLSLFLCGQMGFGLSPLANQVHGMLMRHGGMLGCTALCGVLFAVAPVLLLRLTSSGIQYSILLRRERLTIAGWVVAFGFYLTLRNQPSDALFTILLWAVPAVLSFYLFGWLVRKLSGIFSWRTDQAFI